MKWPNNLHILTQKQGNNRNHVNHTRKIDHDYQPKKTFFIYEISKHSYRKYETLRNKGKCQRKSRRNTKKPSSYTTQDHSILPHFLFFSFLFFFAPLEFTLFPSLITSNGSPSLFASPLIAQLHCVFL